MGGFDDAEMEGGARAPWADPAWAGSKGGKHGGEDGAAFPWHMQEDRVPSRATAPPRPPTKAIPGLSGATPPESLTNASPPRVPTQAIPSGVAKPGASATGAPPTTPGPGPGGGAARPAKDGVFPWHLHEI
mmetsp:Transcript_61280/g.200367  ORF Transcript_61280/g.200367 Transcript_61280/m.200367 type:complete len:131 (+) Transcript_61280:1086-1478(+)